MTFKSAPLVPDAVSISAAQAASAKSMAPSKMDEAHAASMARAKKIDEDVAPILGAKDVPARYKIELFFGPNRSHLGPNAVSLKFWESGRRLHGGGDDLMYMCRNNEEGKEREGCQAIFSSDHVKKGIAICPECQKAINAEKLTRGLTAKFTTRRLASEVAYFWRKLHGDADIYCKFDRTDIRYRALEGEMGPQRAKELRGMSIYPLRNIISDTAHGATLENRIFAFLTA